MPFTPSKYQSAIFHWISNGSGNAIINAVAGSGKTTTLVEASKLITDRKLLFAAFNKHIVGELQERLPENVTCKTIHSIGMGCLLRRFPKKKFIVEEFKYRAYCINNAKQIHERLTIQYNNKLNNYDHNSDIDLPEAPPKLESIQEQLEDIISLSRCTLTDVEDIEQLSNLIDHFGIECPVPVEPIMYLLKNIIDTGESEALDRQYIDFTDMLWLTYKWNLQPGKYNWILVDEAQDLNAAQLHLVRKMANEQTRFLFVGDPCQAIYGFSGADARSFFKIKDECRAIEYPLSICYRCPTKVIDLAKEIVPTIEAAPNKEGGLVLTIKETEIFSHLQEGDVILSRSTEPLIRTCFKLLSRKINAAIKGKDIRKTLVGIVRHVEERENFDYKKFIEHLRNFAVEKAAKLRQKPNNDRKLIELADQIASIEVCYTAFNSTSLDKFISELDELFNEESAGILLSTIHKAKGLEENRIFILYPEKLPLKWDKQKDWQLQQEINLKYVALTRPKQALIFVSEVHEENFPQISTFTLQ